MKQSRIKHPKMVPGVIKAKMRDEEDMDMKAEGGEVKINEEPVKELQSKAREANMEGILKESEKKSLESVMPKPFKMAKGGSIADAIMNKRRMAEGGIIEENNKEQPNAYYNINENEVLDHNMNEPIMETSQPEDSNMISPEHEMMDERDMSMIDKIRSRMRSRAKV